MLAGWVSVYFAERVAVVRGGGGGGDHNYQRQSTPICTVKHSLALANDCKTRAVTTHTIHTPTFFFYII